MTRLIVTTATVLALGLTGTCYGGWPFHRHQGHFGHHQYYYTVPSGPVLTGARFDRFLDVADRGIGVANRFTPGGILDDFTSDSSESAIVIRPRRTVEAEIVTFDFGGTSRSGGGNFDSDTNETGDVAGSQGNGADPPPRADNEEMKGLREDMKKLGESHRKLLKEMKKLGGKLQDIDEKLDFLIDQAGPDAVERLRSRDRRGRNDESRESADEAGSTSSTGPLVTPGTTSGAATTETAPAPTTETGPVTTEPAPTTETTPNP